MQAVLDAALEHYRRDQFLRGANADYGALQRSTAAWNRLQRERQAWEATDKDSLDAE